VNLDELASGLPKTELVYLSEMNCAKLDAKIVRAVSEKRTHAYLVLDRTIFHPKGGGQPSDRGTVGSPAFSLTVKKAMDHKGVVIHWGKIISGTISEGQVACELDWPYRHLLMRRHTAAHLLDHCLASAISKQVQTTDSWLDEPCYVGYSGKAPALEDLKKAEDLANTMIMKGAGVGIDYLTPEESGTLLRTAPNFERLPNLQEIRIVTIAGCTPIPCGGTHVSNTSELEKLKITQAEQLTSDTYRVYFSV